MNRFQIVVGMIIAVVLARLVASLLSQRLGLRRFFIQFLFWTAVLAAVLVPEGTTQVARFFNITRGVDFVVYLSIMALFYVVTVAFERIERTDRALTQVVRRLAIAEKQAPCGGDGGKKEHALRRDDVVK